MLYLDHTDSPLGPITMASDGVNLTAVFSDHLFKFSFCHCLVLLFLSFRRINFQKTTKKRIKSTRAS